MGNEGVGEPVQRAQIVSGGAAPQRSSGVGQAGSEDDGDVVAGAAADAGDGGSRRIGQVVGIGGNGHAPDDTEAPPPTIVAVRCEPGHRSAAR